MRSAYRRFLRFLVFILGMGICFNNIAVTGSGRNFTVGFLSFGTYFIVILPLLLRKPSIAFRHFSRSILLPLIFFMLLTIMNAIYQYAGTTVSTFDLTFFFCWVMFVVLLVHGMYDSKALTYLLCGFAVGVMLMGILFWVGIGYEIDDGGRLKMFGDNSNVIGILCDVGFIIFMNELLIRDFFNLGKWKWIFAFFLIPDLAMLLATGSRTAFIIFVFVFLISLLFLPTRNGWVKLLCLIVGITILVLGYLSFVNSESVMLIRILSLLQEGNTSHRTEIWNRLLPFVGKHPLFGVGQTGYLSIARQALSDLYNSKEHGFSPHNVFLEVTLYCGLVGLCIMSVFWIRIFITAFRSYFVFRDIEPMLLCVPIVACLLSAQLLNCKFAWMIFAVIISNYYNKASQR